jgi:hypothetical protein
VGGKCQANRSKSSDVRNDNESVRKVTYLKEIIECDPCFVLYRQLFGT